MPSPHVAHTAHYRRNLRRLYTHATPADISEGMAWYPTAVAGCHAWADHYGLDYRTVACVIAAISPQCDWTSNLRIALELLSGQTIVTGGALRANVQKARRILADGATDLTSYFVVGSKVNAFAHNLQGDPDAITIDNHAVQAAMNAPTTTIYLRVTAYNVFVDIYRDVADSLRLRPCDFQAIIWCVWKRRHSPAQKRALIRAQREKNR